ncbi:MAG: bifunctional methylenetetrahydrofolate dehydrogenase/methenyltetrahydrofolate cyclohydrolase FolD [Alphaproteobacteria bacterium]
MTPQILDGKTMAQNLRSRIKENIVQLGSKAAPGLAVILVGDDAASSVYVNSKIKACHEVGIQSFEHRLASTTSEEELIELIEKLNNNKDVNGILVQLPLPKHMNEERVLAMVDFTKDVDGFHTVNAGLLSIGSDKAIIPCTPMGCMIMLRSVIDNFSGLNAVVIGRSNIVGKPMANLLLKENCTVTIVHSRTKNIKEICQNADILVAAVGVAEMVGTDYVKKGAYIIDVGINRIEDASKPKGYRLTGDVDFEAVAPKAAAITPVPGGVGPMTIACLMLNTLICFCRQNNLPLPETY